jgi:ParB-like chromosome segregation protein Spo0J
MAPRSLRTLADKGVHGIRREDGVFFNVPPASLLEEPGFNIRSSYDDPDVKAHIEGLADAYAAGRYVPPITVRVGDDDGVYLLDGHCRRLGALLAIERGHHIPFIQCLALKANDVERVEVMLRSGEGLKYKPLEIAEGYHRLVRMGLTPAEIAKKVGKSVSHVDGMLLLACANSDVHRLVREGKIAATVAIEAVRAHGEKAGSLIEASVGKAEARGKPRVTAGVLKQRPISAKLAGRVFGTLARASSILPPDARQRIEGLNDDDQVEVSVHLYREMLDALEAVQEAGTEPLERKPEGPQEAAPGPLLDIMAA